MTTYYVSSVSGADSNNGTSQSTPFATLQQAANDTQPGDTVLVMSGTYTRPGAGQVLDITRSGTANAPITYEAAPGQHPVIDSSNLWAGIKIDGASYITINGFEVKGDAASVTLAQAQALESNYADPTTSGGGILTSTSSNVHSTHLLIENNVVHDEPGGGIDAEHSDYVSILNNTVYDNAWWSPYGNSGINNFEMYSSDSNTGYKNIIAGNVAYGNREYIPANASIPGSGITDGNGIIVDSNNLTGYNGRTLVENNLTHDNGGSGAHAWNSNNVDFLYNTAYDNNQSPEINDGQIFAASSAGSRVENNIMVALNGKNVDGSGSGVTYDYNVDSGSSSIPSKGPHDIVADPKFVAPGSNFQLQSGSPAINSANSAFTVATDIAGDPRPSGGGYDSGAYQYQAAQAQDTLVLNLSADLYNGPPQFTVSVDGKQEGAAQNVTALHSAGQSQAFTFTGNFGSGTHDIAVTFLNDAWGGSSTTDRNLYVNSLTYDGQKYASAFTYDGVTYKPPFGNTLASMLWNGTAHFTVTG